MDLRNQIRDTGSKKLDLKDWIKYAECEKLDQFDLMKEIGLSNWIGEIGFEKLDLRNWI